MQSKNYKENLKEALKNLVRVNESIFDSLVDISMQNDLKEWSETVPIGEAHSFDFDIFKNSSDANIQLLVKLFEQIEETSESIKNINNIQLDE